MREYALEVSTLEEAHATVAGLNQLLLFT